MSENISEFFSTYGISFVLTFFSAGLSVFIAYCKFSKKLDRLLERDFQGVLTKEQANYLIGIYADLIKKELLFRIDTYCKVNLPKLKESPGDMTLIRERLSLAIRTNYENARDSVINRFHCFKIGPTKSFVEVIHAADRAQIPDVIDATVTAMVNFIEDLPPFRGDRGLEELCIALGTRTSHLNLRGKSVMQAEVEKYYENFSSVRNLWESSRGKAGTSSPGSAPV